MSLSKINYTISEARKNVVRNGLMSVASLFTIMCCLIILGVFMLLTLNVNTVTEQIKDKCEVQLFLDMNTEDERVESIYDEILSVSNVKSAELYTKEDMLEFAVNEMFEDRKEMIEDFEDDNPFSDSYKITLHDLGKAPETVAELEELANVDHVVNKQDVVNLIISISSVVKKASIVIMTLLLIVSVVIISNTVRLTVFNRRKEINIMKYIGATDRFIRIPFLVEGIMIGFIAALVSFMIMGGAYYFLVRYLDSVSFTMFELIDFKTVALWLAGVFLLVGGFIGMIGSAISMKKYLKV